MAYTDRSEIPLSEDIFGSLPRIAILAFAPFKTEPLAQCKFYCRIARGILSNIAARYTVVTSSLALMVWQQLMIALFIA